MNIHDKIRSLLARAASTDSEAEAIACLAKADKLMHEHQIAAHELGDNSDPIGMTVGLRNVQAGPPSYKYEVQRVLAAYYGCKFIRMREQRKPGSKVDYWRAEFVGPLSARVTTELMTEYVWDQLKAVSKRDAKEYGIAASKQLRMTVNAFTLRVWQLVRERRAEEAKAAEDATVRNVKLEGSTALTILLKDEVVAAFEALYPDVTKGRAGSRSSNAAAKKAAAEIGLSRQVNGGGSLRIGRS